MEYNTSRSDELQHWGIKGMKWGVRRFENPDGTLTEAGKKRYNKKYPYQDPDTGSLNEKGQKDFMKAARSGKLDYHRLPDKEIDMINNRFNKENTLARNMSDYEKSTFKYRAKEAMIARIKGNGGGGGKKGGGGGGKKSGNILATIFKTSIEEAMKTYKPKNSGKKDDKKDDEKEENSGRDDVRRVMENGASYFETGYKEDAFARREREERGRQWFQSAYQSAEDILRGRNTRTKAREDNSPRNLKGLPSGGITLDPDEYSIHSGIIRYKVKREEAHIG